MDKATERAVACITGDMMGLADAIKDEEVKAILQEAAEKLLALAGYELTGEPGRVRPIQTGRAN